jgi:hypothetical protein
MATTASGTMKELRKEVSKDITGLSMELYQEIVRTTPRRTGTASRSWTKPPKVAEDNYNVVVTTSPLPYIQPLEDGHSKQAPNGFIQPAIDKITRKRQ